MVVSTLDSQSIAFSLVGSIPKISIYFFFFIVIIFMLLRYNVMLADLCIIFNGVLILTFIARLCIDNVQIVEINT